ncbi:MAG: alpha/beta hydrolase-fold protein [Ignavibacteriaceae bacterium]
MKKIFLFLTLAISGLSFPQSQFEQFINYVNSLGDSSVKAGVIDSFINVARQQGIPFIEDSTANFIYLGTPNNVTVPVDFNSWNANLHSMTKLEQTNFWYVSEVFEMNARLDYKFVLNGSNWILDPENPNTVLGGFGPNSELAMPEYVQPWEIAYNPNINHGTQETKSIFSTHLNATYQLKIYLPPGYNGNSPMSYPAVYFQDGFEYLNLASAINVFDNLLDSNKIEPLIGVFVKPNNRNTEYGGDLREEYQVFFIEELVPFIDSSYNTITESSNRLVLGASLGGNISSLICYNYPDVFANCGIHSGALWVNNNEALNLIINGPKKDIKWSSIWGSYEGSIRLDMSMMKDELITKGYEIDWLELPEDHSWGLWRATIDRILEYFFPSSATRIEDKDTNLDESFILKQNYPNPFNPSTTISYSVPEISFVTLKVYDVLGSEITTLVNEERTVGNYELEFSAKGGSASVGDATTLPSGIYFYKLQTSNFTQTKKMILLK